MAKAAVVAATSHPSPPCAVDDQLVVFRRAAAALIEAQQVHARARAVYDGARDQLEDRRRALVVSTPIPLGNTRDKAFIEARDATISLSLVEEAGALRQAREVLRNTETTLEIARIVERTEREALRASMARGTEQGHL